jgi:hypothetical protein
MKTNLLKTLMKKFGVSKKDFDKHKEYYNNHFEDYDNEIYEDVKTRLVHFGNFFDNNWFNKRYGLLQEKYALFDCIIEVGFGLPYLPLKIKKEEEIELPKLVYVDKYSSAIEVSKLILDKLKVNAKLIKSDIGEMPFWSNLIIEKRGKTLLVCIEVLEHLKNPEKFWINAKKLNPSKILISLPISPKIPSHHSFFKNVKEEEII